MIPIAICTLGRDIGFFLGFFGGGLLGSLNHLLRSWLRYNASSPASAAEYFVVLFPVPRLSSLPLLLLVIYWSTAVLTAVSVAADLELDQIRIM